MSLLGGSRCISIPRPGWTSCTRPLQREIGNRFPSNVMSTPTRGRCIAGSDGATWRGCKRPAVADELRLHGDRSGTGVLARGRPTTPQMDLLYVKDLGHVLAAFTPVSEPYQLEASAAAFLAAGLY